MAKNSITSFTGEHAFLANSYPCFVKLDTMTYPDVESAYQAAKSWDIRDRLSCKASHNALEVWERGQTFQLREDWEKVKISIMWDLISQKFENPKLKALLLATGDALLINGGRNGDAFWGQINGEGKNQLGELLMRLRNKLQGQK